MAVLGIDYGDKHVGLAYRADDVDVVVPFGTLERHDDATLGQEIYQLVAAEDITAVVVGMPVHTSGRVSEQSQKTTQFIEQLQQIITIPIHTVSEVLTSKAAADMPYPQASIHEKSALLILQEWLANQ